MTPSGPPRRLRAARGGGTEDGGPGTAKGAAPGCGGSVKVAAAAECGAAAGHRVKNILEVLFCAPVSVFS